MRKILFRGKPKNKGDYHFFSQCWKDKCKDGFVYGSLVIDKGRYYICVTALCSINSCVNNGMTSMLEVIPETVGECTNLTDKNGKEIFEGDVIEIRNDNAPIKKSVAVVKFGEFKPKFFYTLYEWYYDRELKDKLHGLYLENVEGEQMFFCSTTTPIRVIGNIYDNPELLRSDRE